jgi:hypothetical protein
MLRICIKKQKQSQYSAVTDVVMNGFPAILKKNHEYVLILSAIVLIGRNLVRTSKKNWCKLISIGRNQERWVSTILDSTVI